MWYETVLLITCSLLSILSIFLILFVILFINKLSKKFEDIKNIKHEFIVSSSQILSEVPDLNILGDLPEIKVFNDTGGVGKQIIEETKKKESEASKLYEEEFKNFNGGL